MNDSSPLTPPADRAPFGGEVRARLVRSFFGSYATTGLVRLVSILTRILVARIMVDSAPEAFGIFAEALLICSFLAAVQSLGIPSHIIRQDRPLHGAFLTATLGTGICLAVLLFLAADLFSGMSPLLPEALRILALSLPIGALANVPLQFINRELRIERLVKVEAVGNLIFLVVAGILAYRWNNIYCLVWANLIASLVKTVVLWFLVWGEIPLTLDRGDIGLLLRGSSRLFILSLLDILFHQADIGIAGAFLTAAEVGFWNMAMIMVLLPTTMIETAFYQVLYPLFSRYKDEPEKLVRAYRASTMFIMGLEVPLYAFLFVAFPTLTVWILGPKWAVAGDIAQLLCVYCLSDPFTTFGQIVIRARGRDWPLVGYLSCSVLAMVLVGLWLVPDYQLLGMVISRYAVLLGDGFVILALIREIGGRHLLIPELGWFYLSFPLIVAAGALADNPYWKLGLSGGVFSLVMILVARKLAPTAREFLEPVWQKFSNPALAQAPKPQEDHAPEPPER